jgi:hypothetical protein
VQQVVSGVYPQAYSHPPQAGNGVRHPTREDLEGYRRLGRQALGETRDLARDRYGEADDDDEEFEEYEEDEDDELYV